MNVGHRLRSITAAVLFLAGAQHARAGDALQIAYPEFWPFFSRSQTGQMRGFFFEIISEALERRMGIEVTWEAFPWARCQELVKRGSKDAMITVPTAERLVYAKTHPDPFYLKLLNVFTYAGHPQLARITQIQEIVDIRHGGFAVITYAGNGWSKANVASLGIRVLETADLKSVWLMLANKRGDLVIEWPQGAWPDIRAAGVAQRVVQTDVVLESMPFHLLIRNGSPHAAILDEFNRVVTAMKNDGAMAKILRDYEQ